MYFTFCYRTIRLSTDPDTEGFDFQAGESWIYPTNYPIREYQFNIIREALLKNTLVSNMLKIYTFFSLLNIFIYNYFFYR